MLNAKTARITRSANPKTQALYNIRELVALFCTERRDKRWGLVGEVVGWQWVTNFEEPAENKFGRILLPRSDAARREGFEVLPAAMPAPPDSQKRD